MLNLIKRIQKMFVSSETCQTKLERFILSKNPESIQEVEYWVKVFDRQELCK